MEIKTFEEIYNDMRNYIVANQDKLTDFNDGSVLMSQVEATAREIALLYISCRVGFSSYLRGLPFSVFGFEQLPGEKASVDLVFSRSKPFSYNTTIPTGTVVKAGGLKFMTTAAGSISSGATESNPVPASAEAVGDKYNTPAKTIKTIVSVLPADIVAVSNPAAATGGENNEDWAAYSDRFADFIVGLQRTNNMGIKTGLTDLIRSIGMKEHFPPLDGIWNMTLYLEDGSGGMTSEDLAEAKKIIDGNFALNIGGFRAPGINIRYMPPEIVPITISATVTTERNVANEIDESVIINQVVDSVRAFVNGLKIEQELKISDLTVLLRRLPSLSDAQITQPVDNIPIDYNQIARFENCDVTVVIG